MLIYLASPYTGAEEERFEAVCQLAGSLMVGGHHGVAAEVKIANELERPVVYGASSMLPPEEVRCSS